jgi:ubiquitin-like 1-activating enzyme E1 B
MAGNIIPAIATTNAIISGIVVLEALHLLRKSYKTLKNVHIQLKPTVPLNSITLSSPNPRCGVCRDTYVTLRCDPTCSILGKVVRGILGVGEEDEEATQNVSVYEEKRILTDPDWEDNYERTLESLNVTQGKFLSIVDEDGELETITIAIASLPYVSVSFFHRYN